MMRALYSAFTYLAQPFLRRKLARRAEVEPGYGVAIEERFGHYDRHDHDGTLALPSGVGFIWLHAVSLGETRAAAPLLARLRTDHPGMRLLLTHGTATGREEGQKLLQSGDVQVWQPWDTPAATRRFLNHFQPRIGILVETEVWPNLVAACTQARVPLVLANARLSDKSLKQSLWLAWLARPAFAALTAVWAQTEADAARLRQLGAPVQGVFGNIKFDAAPKAEQLALGRQWASQARDAGRPPVLMFASSREGEEGLLLQALQASRAVGSEENSPSAFVNTDSSALHSIADGRSDAAVQWLIVPRHPQRFDEVAALLAAHGYAVSRRSSWPSGPPPDAAPNTVWLGDSLGEMALYYGLADVVLLGGSFAPLGGQNLIEAAACGCPVVMGPHTFNFLEASALALAADAAQRVGTVSEALTVATVLALSPAAQERMADNALTFAQAHRGAVAKTAAAIQGVLETHRSG